MSRGSVSADDVRVRTYAAAAGALGAIALWGSEMFFWSAPQEPVNVISVGMTWFVYALCSAAALSLVLVTGIQGWRAMFLGGAVMGWLIEGVVVATAYDAFPFQVVWTPLAWHGLVTGLVVLGLGRPEGRWPAWRRALTWGVVGVAGGLWASWWPLERGGMPGLATTVPYLVGLGLLVPLGHVALDRLVRVPVPSRRVLLVAPVLLLVGWLVRVVLAPSPLYLVLPMVLGLTAWVMRRWGDGPIGLELSGVGVSGGLRAHAWFLLAPVGCALVASLLWWAAPEGLPANIVVALGTVAISLWLFGRLVLGGLRRERVEATAVTPM